MAFDDLIAANRQPSRQHAAVRSIHLKYRYGAANKDLIALLRC